MTQEPFELADIFDAKRIAEMLPGIGVSGSWDGSWVGFGQGRGRTSGFGGLWDVAERSYFRLGKLEALRRSDFRVSLQLRQHGAARLLRLRRRPGGRVDRRCPRSLGGERPQ